MGQSASGRTSGRAPLRRGSYRRAGNGGFPSAINAAGARRRPAPPRESPMGALPESGPHHPPAFAAGAPAPVRAAGRAFDAGRPSAPGYAARVPLPDPAPGRFRRRKATHSPAPAVRPAAVTLRGPVPESGQIFRSNLDLNVRPARVAHPCPMAGDGPIRRVFREVAASIRHAPCPKLIARVPSGAPPRRAEPRGARIFLIRSAMQVKYVLHSAPQSAIYIFRPTAGIPAQRAENRSVLPADPEVAPLRPP
jgi:hypothetical protein